MHFHYNIYTSRLSWLYGKFRSLNIQCCFHDISLSFSEMFSKFNLKEKRKKEKKATPRVVWHIEMWSHGLLLSGGKKKHIKRRALVRLKVINNTHYRSAKMRT